MAQSPQLKHSSPTSPDPQDFRLDATPAMRADNVVSGDHWRIGLITDSLVRFEWSDSGVFENRPTQTVLNRDFGSPVERRVTERDGRVIIDTAALTIVYDQQPFSKEGLSVVVKGVADTQFNTWHYGDAQRGNLKGTARTLDEADGAIELDNGVISRDGWAVIDDSAANIIIETDTVNGKANPFGTWVSPRATAETDLYFFGYGHRYIEAVRDFYRLTGPTPLLPRFAMGNWWSRYYRYTQDGYLALMDRFKREGIPFTTSVIDMDWHRVDDVDPKYGSGWTGYSWNRELFPDPPAFLADLHRRGLRTTLNVHPRDGVRAFEDAYPEVAKRVGIDPATEENVEFDLTNPDFVDAYFDMHHRMEAEGVDFWWLDWQQGGVTRQKGLDPLWMLNHMHYLDSGRGGNWPLTFSRYAGPGSHRYPVGFSGDTIVTWESLAFQPQFTATASNIGYGWWSHDIGGHMFGYRNEELEARWYQLGAFSPINRLHSSNSAGRRLEVWRSLDRTPVFAKAGAIVPLQDVAESGEAINSIANPQALCVLVFPGADGSFVMREDRGTWGATSADTAIAFTWGGADASPSAFTVAPVTGDTSAVPESRDWTVVFRGIAPVDAASGGRAWSGEAPVEATVAYDEATMSLTVSVTGISSAASLRIEIPGGLRIADNPVESDAMDLLLHAQMLYRTKELALQAVHKLGIGAIGALRTMNRGPRYANDFWITDMPDAVAGALEEILLRS